LIDGIACEETTRWRLKGFHFFMNPIDVVGDVDGTASQLEHRKNVRTQGIADHQESFGGDVEVSDQFQVGFSVFFTHHLDVMEVVRDAGSHKFAFLIHEIALGRNNQAIVRRKSLKRRFYSWQELDRMVEHGFADLDDLLDLTGTHLMVADADRSFDQRKGEALDAVAKDRNILDLCFVVFFDDGGWFDPFFADLSEANLCFLKIRLVDP